VAGRWARRRSAAPSPEARLLALEPRAGRVLAAAIGLSVGAALATLGAAGALSAAIAGTVLGTRTTTETAGLVGILVALVAARSVLIVAGEGLMGRAARLEAATVRDRLTAHLTALGPAYVTGERSGELASTMVDGLDAVEAWVRSFRPASRLALLVPVLALLVVLALDPPSALVLVVTGPMLVLLLALIGRGVAPATAARAAELRWMQGYFADMLGGLETLRAYGRSREQSGRIRDIGLRYADATMTVLRTAFQASLVLEWGAAIAMAFIAVELSLRLMTGGIGFEATLAVLVIAPEFFVPLRRLAAAYHEGAAGREASARILQVLDAPVPRLPATPVVDAAGGAVVPAGDFVLRGVTVTYPGRSEPALRDVDLVIAAGRRTVIVGPSGAGKSTVARLLMRFVEPDRGSITDGGRDVGAIAIAAWRAGIGYVPQSPHLFHGTVADNIRLGRPGASMDAVVAAARDADADAFIADLPAGYDTPVGEDGVRLSGGQRQRIAIARAFLRDAPLLVLDEPTAHLDPDAEASVAASIARLGDGRTVVVISHRPALLAGADAVVELVDGQLAR
jgi:ATP-binding cassette subfamily C protein CydD